MSSTSVNPPAARVFPWFAIRDPDVWLMALAWLTVVFSALQILLFAFGRDQAIYALLGEGILNGRLPYRDLWDFKPPGIYLIYAVAQGLFGKVMLAPRLLEVVGLGVSLYCFTRFSERFFGLRRIGLLGGALAALVHAELEFWHTAQPETFGGFLTIGALYWISRSSRRAWLAWLFVGVLFGCAFLLKPPLGGGVLVCAAYVAGERRASGKSTMQALLPAWAMLAGLLLPIALCVLWFALNGGLAAMYWTLAEFTPGYTALGWQGQGAARMFYQALTQCFVGFSALLAFGTLAAFLIPAAHSRERSGCFLLLGIISVHLAGIAMQGKFFPYHYAATLPLVALLAGLGLYKLWRRCLGAKAGGIVAYASFLIVSAVMQSPVRDLPSGFWERSWARLRSLASANNGAVREAMEAELSRVADYDLGANRRVAAFLRNHLARDTPLFVWGFEPMIYWLSEQPPASRFIYNVPQRATWQQRLARTELLKELRRTQPGAIVVQSNDVFPAVTGSYADSARALASFEELRKLLNTRYEWVERIEDFDIYLAEASNESSRH